MSVHHVKPTGTVRANNIKQTHDDRRRRTSAERQNPGGEQQALRTPSFTIPGSLGRVCYGSRHQFTFDRDVARVLVSRGWAASRQTASKRWKRQSILLACPRRRKVAFVTRCRWRRTIIDVSVEKQAVGRPFYHMSGFVCAFNRLSLLAVFISPVIFTPHSRFSRVHYRRCLRRFL
jgi:hypothetical protein